MHKKFFPLLIALIAMLLPFTLPIERAAAQAPAVAPARVYTSLTADYTPLREQFNKDQGKLRLLMLLSPS